MKKIKRINILKAKAIAKAKEKGLAANIIRESIKVLLISSILVTIGGVGLKFIEDKLIILIPFLILIPALNKMIGDFGIIIVSKFTTMIYQKKIRKPLLHSHNLKHLFKDIFPIAVISAVYVAVLATMISTFKGFDFSFIFLFKIISITVTITVFLIFLHFLIAVFGGMYVYRKGHDPDDLLIPITTSIADLGGLLMLTLFIVWLF